MVRPSINSAEFNVREIAKQFILLEDHLADDEKYCQDCIRKHLLAVEAYAEEAVTLDPKSKWISECRFLAKMSRDLLVRFGGGIGKEILAQEIRQVRKRLVAVHWDPRVKGGEGLVPPAPRLDGLDLMNRIMMR